VANTYAPTRFPDIGCFKKHPMSFWQGERYLFPTHFIEEVESQTSDVWQTSDV